VRWGLVPRERRGRMRGSLGERELRGVEKGGFWRERMRVLVKRLDKKGEKLFLGG